MRVAIIGLGLIGGSVGLALKQSGWHGAEIVGYVRNAEVGRSALRLGIVDRVESGLKDSVRDADIVLIAIPVLAIKDILMQIAPAISSGCIVTDVASTKSMVMCWAKELLPPTVNFIGGHPMAGKEISGIDAATADLFKGCVYCLTPEVESGSTALQTVTDMVTTLGATPMVIDAQEHDSLVAGISHLPMLLSSALVSVTTQSPSWSQMSRLASSGYRDVTRLASGNPEMNAHICLSNQKAIISWLDDFIETLQKWRGLIANGSNEIENAFDLARKARERWLKSDVKAN